MFKKKDPELNHYVSLESESIVDGREEVEQAYHMTKINKKRNRRSLILPGELVYDEEEIDLSRDVVSKRRQMPERGTRSLLLPSDEGNEFSCENRESANVSGSSQSLMNNEAPSSQKSNTIWEETCLSSSSTNIITATSIATTNLANDQSPQTQLLQPLLPQPERNTIETIRRSSIFYDDSSRHQEEDRDINSKIRKRSRQSMFKKKDPELNHYVSLESESIVDGREEVEQAYHMTKINKKRNRRSLILPGELVYDEEEIDLSRDVVSKRRQMPERGTRSLLLPSDEGNEFSCENRESANVSGSSQSLMNNEANIITTSNAVTSIATTNLVIDEQPKENRSFSSTPNAINPCAGKLEEEQKHGQQQIKSRKFSPVNKDELNQMKIAIRKLCSIPLQERYKSEDAGILHIRDTIGYPLTSAIDKLRHQQEIKDVMKRNDDASAASSLNLDWKFSPKNNRSTLNEMDASDRDGITARAKESEETKIVITNDMKRSILMKMCPVVEVIEARRKEEEAFVEACTGCCVERKKGRFKYMSLSTGKKVSSSKYQKLYLEMIRKRHLELQKDRREKVEVAPHLAAALRQKMPSNSCISHKPQGGQITFENKDIISPIGERTLCNEVDEKDSEEPQCVPEEEFEPLMLGDYCSKNSTTPEEIRKGTKHLDRGYSRDDEDFFPIGDDIPSRDNLSPNPEIAALQITLFSAIDVALGAYSDGVLRLRERQSSEQHTLMDT